MANGKHQMEITEAITSKTVVVVVVVVVFL